MEKKIIFLELPSAVIERIDEKNTTGSRSVFIAELLEKQLDKSISTMTPNSELSSMMQRSELQEKPGEITLLNNRGISLGRFNINTVEGFEQLGQKICETSNDPIVRMKARRWR